MSGDQRPARALDRSGCRDRQRRPLKGWITGVHHGRDSFDLAALALHADAGATTALIDLSTASQATDLRKDAIFWLGHARGAAGADFVERVATADPNADLREHAVFALSQSSEQDAYERVRAISKRDASGEVRGKALFWMAQMHDPRAQADILAALGSESSEPVREEAVFALSQLDEAIATKALIAVIRGDYPRPVKEKALFWLGQAGTDEAMAFHRQRTGEVVIRQGPRRNGPAVGAAAGPEPWAASGVAMFARAGSRESHGRQLCVVADLQLWPIGCTARPS